MRASCAILSPPLFHLPIIEELAIVACLERLRKGVTTLEEFKEGN